MNFETILRKLNAIGGMQGAVTEEKKPDADKDGVPDWADKKPGADDTESKEDKKEKANEDIMNVMRGLKAIQEAEDEHCSKCDCTPCECDDKVDEALNTSKLADTMGVDAQRLRGAVARATAGKQSRSDVMLLSDTFVKLLNNPDDTAIQAIANLIKSGNSGGGKPENTRPDIVMKQEGNEFSGALKAAKDAGEEEFEVGGKKYKVNECGDMEMSPMTAMAAAAGAPEESKDRYTLTITKADGSSLNAITDIPEELMQIMKLAGVGQGGEVTQTQASVPTEEPEVEEAFGNTPAQTQEREPRSFGDTKNWGLPGTARADVRYTPPQQGDNPMKEEVGMFEEYKVFKESK